MKRAAIALALALAMAFCARAAAAKPAPYALLPGHIDLATGPDGNTVILDAPQGLIVVDTGRHPAHAEAILAHARAAKRPLVAIINTHWHLDHTTGNRDMFAAFPAAQLVATNAASGALQGFLATSAERVRARLADAATPEADRRRLLRSLTIIEDRPALVPASPVVRSGTRIIGGRRLDVRVAPRAVTEADLWILVPDEQLAIVGDLVVAQFPFFDTGCEKGWLRALAAIDRASWTTLIPGHGPAMDRAAFRRWRSAFVDVVNCARSDKPSSACAAAWETGAAGFFAEAERADVRDLAIYYVDEILRAPPAKRMGYCRLR